MERSAFGECVRQLAAATRLPDRELTPDLMRVYFDALADFPLEAVRTAAMELIREAQWFPKTAEWRSVAAKARNAQAIARTIPAARGWQSECNVCDDTGWEPLACPETPCQRTREHAPHSYVVECACRLQNATYQRKRAEERERARRRQAASTTRRD